MGQGLLLLTFKLSLTDFLFVFYNCYYDAAPVTDSVFHTIILGEQRIANKKAVKHNVTRDSRTTESCVKILRVRLLMFGITVNSSVSLLD
jgi:hypothetical protein